MTTANQAIADRIEAQARAITKVRYSAAALATQANSFRVALDEFETDVQELRRMMEAGALLMQASRAFDVTWKRLP